MFAGSQRVPADAVVDRSRKAMLRRPAIPNGDDGRAGGFRKASQTGAAAAGASPDPAARQKTTRAPAAGTTASAGR